MIVAHCSALQSLFMLGVRGNACTDGSRARSELGSFIACLRVNRCFRAERPSRAPRVGLSIADFTRGTSRQWGQTDEARRSVIGARLRQACFAFETSLSRGES